MSTHTPGPYTIHDTDDTETVCQQWRLVSIGGGAYSDSTVLYRHI